VATPGGSAGAPLPCAPPAEPAELATAPPPWLAVARPRIRFPDNPGGAVPGSPAWQATAVDTGATMADPGTWPELVTLADAARLSGRSERTIRRWVHEGTLRDLRAAGDRTSPVRVRTAELRAHLATLSPPALRADGAPAGVATPAAGHAGQAAGDGGNPAGLVAELRAALADARETIADLRRTRDGQAERIARLEAERVELLREAGDARRAVEAVQRASAELGAEPARSGGRVRALLRAVWPRLAGDEARHAAH